MQLRELEQYLTEFSRIARQAEADFNSAVAAEQYYEDATQDILHSAEFAPSTLQKINLVTALTDIRTQRRDAKKELEGAKVWKDWAVENKKSFDKLDQVLGQLRKIMKWQANSMYRFKTDLVAEKDSYLVADPEPTPEPEYVQLSIFDLIKENKK